MGSDCHLMCDVHLESLQKINQELQKVLNQCLQNSSSEAFGHVPSVLAEAICYSVFSPGKRIRTRLFLSTAEMLGLSIQKVLPAALSLEILHCFTLIHDDLPCMDNADWRRGLLSNHRQFGESIAVLSGDSLLVLGFEVFLKADIPIDLLLLGLKRLLHAIGPHGVLGGQVGESALQAHSVWGDLQGVHRQKTGALFAAAVLIPKDFAQIADQSSEGVLLSSFADELGLAFQIADDLEDDSQSSEINKPTHVLFYQKRLEIYQETILRLEKVSQQLLQKWPEKGQGLKNFAQEVMNKLKQTQAG